MSDAWLGPPANDESEHPCETCGALTRHSWLVDMVIRPGTNRLAGVVQYECKFCEATRRIAYLTELQADREKAGETNPRDTWLADALVYWRDVQARECLDPDDVLPF